MLQIQRKFVCLAVLALISGSCASPGATWIERGKGYFARGNFYQAFYCLQAARAEGDDGPEVQKLYWPYRIAYLMKRAQMRVFANEDSLALEDLAKVLAVEPDHETAKRWVHKAKTKLAAAAVVRGDSAMFEDDLETALVAYHEALTFRPGYPLAKEGLQRVADAWEKRRAKASDRYIAGVRALAEQLFGQTEYHMLIALEADPTHENAESSRAEAAVRLHEIRFQRAKEMQDKGHYGAAMIDYQWVQKQDAEFPGVADRIAQCEVEVAAQQLAEEGELALFRGDYEKARELIDQAFEKSASERLKYNELLLLTRDKEYGDKYVAAKDLQFQGFYEEAAERYASIDADYPGFLDVKARMDDLRASIDLAKESYDLGVAAEEAGKSDEALEHYEDAELHYAKYSDLGARLQRLRAARDTDSEAKSESQ